MTAGCRPGGWASRTSVRMDFPPERKWVSVAITMDRSRVGRGNVQRGRRCGLWNRDGGRDGKARRTPNIERRTPNVEWGVWGLAVPLPANLDHLASIRCSE